MTKWCKIYTKTDSWFQKSREEFEQLQGSSGKSKKLKFDGLLLSKKYIPSARIYTEDLSNITFNYLGENSINYLCHKSFFTTELLFIFLGQTLYTTKIAHQSANFQTSLLRLKFTKFLMSFFK